MTHLLRCPHCQGFNPHLAHCPHCDAPAPQAEAEKASRSGPGAPARAVRAIAKAGGVAAMAVTLMACYGAYGECYDDECDGYQEIEICTDGIDNNLDGLVDCADATCSQTPECQIEICDDGVDNDLDGIIDCSDADCQGLAPCTEPTGACDAAIQARTDVLAFGIGASPGTNEMASTCGGAGSEQVIQFSPSSGPSSGPVDLVLLVNADAPVTVSARSGCEDAGSELACAEGALNHDLRIPFESGPSDFAVIIDSESSTVPAFTISAAFVDPATCGDARITFGEQCDDGNNDGGDGCSPYCFIEPNFYCSMAIPLTEGELSGDSTTGSHAVSGEGCAGPEALYAFTAPTDGVLDVAAVGAADHALKLIDTCHAHPFTMGACTDLTGPGETETLSTSLLAGETVYIAVDGATASDAGSFTLTTTFTEAL